MEKDKDKRSSSFYVDQVRSDEEDGDNWPNKELQLLEGEVIASQCDRVILYTAFSDNRQGMVGKLFCTDYRWWFVPAINVHDPCCSRSEHLANKFQMAFASIDEIHYAPRNIAENKKFRLMTVPISETEGGISCLKIYSKDFRVIVFDFSVSQFSVQLANQIFHFAFPRKLDTIFGCAIKNSHKNLYIPPSFKHKVDWEKELQRTGAAVHQWRVSQFNSGFRHIENYPQFLVVPQNIVDHMLVDSCENWIGCRFPIWCWCSPNGCAILRSSDMNAVSPAATDQWNRFLNGVGDSHPNRLLPQVVDVSIPWQLLNSSYASLKRLCTVDSSSLFWSEDNQWYSSIEKSHWIELVSTCLQMSFQVVQVVDQKLSSVIIKETEACDIACVVSSISQLCMDPYFRTINGFPLLIQKEWVALCHPFALRLFGFARGHAGQQTDAMMPVFLLFLDCVSQLIEQYPSEFEFSSIYLVSLWDVALSGLTSTFTCNNLKQLKYSSDKRSTAWPIEKFYLDDQVKLFRNPLCLAKKIGQSVSGVRSSVSDNVLIPAYGVSELHFWSDCYLRWIAPAQVRKGGQVQREVVISSLLVELSQLVTTKNNLLMTRDGIKRPPTRLYDLHPVQQRRVSVSSGYPYLNETVAIPDDGHKLPVITQAEKTVRSQVDLRAASSESAATKDLDVTFSNSNFHQSHSSPSHMAHSCNDAPVTLPTLAESFRFYGNGTDNTQNQRDTTFSWDKSPSSFKTFL